MSGTSYSDTCPSCGSELDSYSDHKPISNSWHTCIHCGFTSYPKYDQMTLNNLNDMRSQYNEDMDLRPEDSDYLRTFEILPECITEPDEWFKKES